MDGETGRNRSTNELADKIRPAGVEWNRPRRVEQKQESSQDCILGTFPSANGAVRYVLGTFSLIRKNIWRCLMCSRSWRHQIANTTKCKNKKTDKNEENEEPTQPDLGRRFRTTQMGRRHMLNTARPAKNPNGRHARGMPRSTRRGTSKAQEA